MNSISLTASRDKGVVADLALPFTEHKAARQCASGPVDLPLSCGGGGGVEFSKGCAVLLQ